MCHSSIILTGNRALHISIPTNLFFSLVKANKGSSIFRHLGDKVEMFKSRGGARRGLSHRTGLYVSRVLITQLTTEQQEKRNREIVCVSASIGY